MFVGTWSRQAVADFAPTVRGSACDAPFRSRCSGDEHSARGAGAAVTSIQPELWVDRGVAALAFYESAFGARVLRRRGR